jgi:hypothetical protein
MFSREFQGSQLVQVVLVFPQIFYPVNKWDGNVEDPAAEKRVITWVSSGPWDVLRLHVGVERWSKQMGPNRSEVRIACICHVSVRVSSPYPKFGPSIRLRPFYTPLAGCGAHCARAFVHRAKVTLGFWPTYWMLSRWQRDDALTCSLGSKFPGG